ncbi:hypothetical protein DTX79_17395, partial [Bacilli bacterium]
NYSIGLRDYLTISRYTCLVWAAKVELLRNKKSEFYKKWQHEYEKMQQVVAQMKSAKVRNTEKIVQFEKELVWMEEEL